MPDAKSCHNPACDLTDTGVGFNRHEWMFESKGDRTSNVRCKLCHEYKKRTGRERSKELIDKLAAKAGLEAASKLVDGGL